MEFCQSFHLFKVSLFFENMPQNIAVPLLLFPSYIITKGKSTIQHVEFFSVDLPIKCYFSDSSNFSFKFIIVPHDFLSAVTNLNIQSSDDKGQGSQSTTSRPFEALFPCSCILNTYFYFHQFLQKLLNFFEAKLYLGFFKDFSGNASQIWNSLGVFEFSGLKFEFLPIVLKISEKILKLHKWNCNRNYNF